MSAFPVISAACAVTQLGWSARPQFLTRRTDLECGVALSYFERNTALGRWTLTYPEITAAEVSTIETFFRAMKGRYSEFTFNDPEGNAHSHCRFDQDSLDITYKQVNSYSLRLLIAEFNP